MTAPDRKPPLDPDSPPLEAIDQTTLPERVAEAIVSGIATGAFAAGERLHESTLVRRLGVSRVPIREGLRLLEAQGLLSSEPQKGHRVASFDAQWVADCYQVRRAIEPTAVARAAAKLRAGRDLDRGLRRILDEMEAHVARGNALGLYRSDLAFHAEIYRIAGNELFMSLWRGLQRHFLIIFALEVQAEALTQEFEYRQHITLLDAMLNADAAALSAEVDRHLCAAPRGGDTAAAARARAGLHPVMA